MEHRPTAWLALWLLAAVGCGGGGGEAKDASAYDLGLVSGTQPTVRVVAFVNPLLEPATISAPSQAGPFAVNAGALPTAPVAPGATFDVTVILTPGLPGLVTGTVRVTCHGASATQDAVLPLRATVEEVRILAFQGAMDFGSVPFGGTAERSVELSNVSTLSIVSFTGLTAPTPDLEVVEPALPFTLGPGQRRSVRFRLSPYLGMDPVDGTVRLRTASVQGDVTLTARHVPAPGMKILDLGRFDLTGGLTETMDVEVPAHVWSFHVAAWRPGHPWPDYLGIGAGPVGDQELVGVARFESPTGRDLSHGWQETNGTFAATVPRSVQLADQLDVGGGTYRLQFQVADAPPAGTQLAVMVVLRAYAGAQAPATGTLDLNIWLGSATGVTPATASQDTLLQGALQAAQQMFQQVGVTIGDIDYYAYTELTGGGPLPDQYASIRAALPTVPGVVENRLNLFLPSGDGGQGGRIPGPFVAHSNHSLAIAGYGATNLPYLIVHESLHHLGLYHVHEDALGDTAPGLQPANIMDISAGQNGTFISPQQGAVIRAHPFIR